MAVQSIRTAVQVRDVAGDHFLIAAGKMPFRKMDGVSHFDDTTQEVGPCSEALDDAGNLLSPRSGPPKVVSCGRFSSGFRIFDDPDFRRGLWGLSIVTPLRNLATVFFVVLHSSTFECRAAGARTAMMSCPGSYRTV
jgi:hypothetical protein